MIYTLPRRGKTTRTLLLVLLTHVWPTRKERSHGGGEYIRNTCEYMANAKMMTLFSNIHQELKKRVLAHAAFSAFYSLISWSVALSSWIFYYYKHGYRKDDGHGRNCHQTRGMLFGSSFTGENVEQMMITESQEATAAGVDFCAPRFANWMPAFVNKKKNF